MTSWVVRLSHRTHLLFLPVLFILSASGLSILGSVISSDDLVRSTLTYKHFVGTSLLFILLPAFLLVASVKLWDSTESMLSELAESADDALSGAVRTALTSVPYWHYGILLGGFLFGLSQNGLYVETIIDVGDPALLDVIFIFQSVCLWVLIAEVVAWRIKVSYAVSIFAQSLDVNVYEIAKFGAVAKMATTDVLMVAAAMAFMPLQSLDAEFRIWNYQAGFLIGMSAAICLFTVPLIGARRSIKRLKFAKIRELSTTLKDINQNNVELLEIYLAHMDRVRSISNWPINFNLITRILGYVIIPPLAWVGAALVERVIDTF